MGNAISPRGDMPKNRVQRQLQGRTVSLNSSPFAEELMQPRFLAARLVRTVVLFVAMGKALGGRLRPGIAVVRAIDFDAKAASYVDTFMSAIRWTNADRFFSGVARDAEYEGFRDLRGNTEGNRDGERGNGSYGGHRVARFRRGPFAAKRFCQMKTKAKIIQIRYALCRLITSVRDTAACLGPRFRTSVGKDGIA